MRFFLRTASNDPHISKMLVEFIMIESGLLYIGGGKDLAVWSFLRAGLIGVFDIAFNETMITKATRR